MSLILLEKYSSIYLLNISLLLFHRAESAHWRLKNMLTTSRGDLCASWDVVNTMMNQRFGVIRTPFKKMFLILSIDITLYFTLDLKASY